MEADEELTGLISRETLIKAMQERKFVVSKPVLNFLMNVLVDKEAMVERFGEYNENDPSIEAILSHRQLNSLIQVFCTCPPFNRGHTNNSNNIQGMIRMAGHYE